MRNTPVCRSVVVRLIACGGACFAVAVCQGQEAVSEPPQAIPDSIPVWEDVPGVPSFIRDDVARRQFRVDGEELAAVVISSGINPVHKLFQGRLLPGRSFLEGRDPDEVVDRMGVGSHEAGIIARTAPGAKLIPAKLFSRDQGGSFSAIAEALEWVLSERHRYRGEHRVLISAVCLTVATRDNLQSFDPGEFDDARRRIWRRIVDLRQAGIVVCAPAGNGFKRSDGQEGMTFPAICPETLSVGAVYDVDILADEAQSSSVLFAEKPELRGMRRGECAAFSQRLSSEVGGPARTDIFAPGLAVLSAGPLRDEDSKASVSGRFIQSGTSSSCAYATGAVLLIQDRARKLTSGFGDEDWLPPVKLIESVIHAGGQPFEDQPRPEEGVTGTGRHFRYLDVERSVQMLDHHYRTELHRIRQMLLKEAREREDLDGTHVLEIPDGVRVLDKSLK